MSEDSFEAADLADEPAFQAVEPDIEELARPEWQPEARAEEPDPAEEPAQAEAPQDISAQIRAAEEVAAEEVTAVLSGVLDRLGAAHHRPFSRS